ncbi:xanthine dehydrogenase family protein molybdopterin-binding subunit [Acuticoccus sp. M5D2P5]|uniref:xanthine dehydrogenase family protein molybdopterin-binding subunit n=1 Tax=Acuticoccus kalidii TaxID=2910977 RepID=UPI001F2F7B90|nr:xanthine dehydrogenase family protein molybdopterin-binding subunit [Acuticoccus kalidii]MCF3933525.1 xanthine dehydrogenase family protein molybdopterin-binding subunit [Acuticoccus kalidii]
MNDNAPQGALGQSIPNVRSGRLVQGGGHFIANLRERDALSAAIVRSPVAHGIITTLDLEAAREVAGVVAVYGAADLDAVCAPWEARHELFPDARVPAERPLAADRVRYVGEPVAIVIAETPFAAMEAAEAVLIEVDELDPLLDPEAATAAGAAPIHPDLAGGAGNVHAVIARRSAQPITGPTKAVSLRLSRLAAQPLETRGVLADYDVADGKLTVHQSHQHPHQMQDIYARLLGLPEHKVRVVCGDVGGAFGMKQQLHPDEMAAVCAARLLGRPVRFTVGRNDSLLSDCQSRDHRFTIEAEWDEAARRVTGFRLRDLCGLGAFPHYPRTSFGESGQAVRLVGAPYAVDRLDAESTLVFQNRPHLGHYRGVGHPVACLATEVMMDRVAREIGEHPIAFRRRHLHDLSAGPVTTPGGIAIDRYRMAECLDALETALGDAPFAARRDEGRMRTGVGIACLLELVAPGPRYYGDGQVRISVNESAVVRMEPSGVVRVATGNTDQGQGADQSIAQIVADELGIDAGAVFVVSGDSENCPYGGGAFGSRGTAHGGAAAHDGARRLKARLLASAGLLLQRAPETLDLKGGAVVGPDGARLMAVADLAATCHFKPYLFPEDHDTGLNTVGRFTPTQDAQVSCAAFAAVVRVDTETGEVHPDRIVAAHDGGLIVNPSLVDAQIQGGTAQGLGQALLEAIRLDDAGQPQTGSWMDYAMPRADDVPAVEVVHIPTLPGEGFAPRGVGEAGNSGAPAAVFNAVLDAIAPLGASLDALPATPLRVWEAIHLR